MNRNLFIYGTIAAMGGFLTGYNSTFTGALPSLIEFYNLSGSLLGITVSIMVLGCLAGGLIASTLANKFGFKRMFVFAGILLFFTPLASALSSSLGIFMVSRVLFGIGYSIAMALAPIYIAEIAPSNIRGKLVSFFQLSIVTGILLAFITIYFVAGIQNDWRFMLGIPAIPAVFYILLIRFIPESPRWLVNKGKEQHAIKVLNKIAGNKYAQSEIIGIQAGSKHADSGNISDLTSTRYRKIVIVGALLTVFQQLTGIAAILTFIPIIFREMGSSSNSAYLQMILVAVVNMVFTLVAVRFSDKWGRKPLLIYGLIFIVFSLLAISVMMYFKVNSPLLSLTFMLLYVASFSASTGPLMWVLLSEIFPAKIKTGAITVATIVYWLSVGGTSYIFPVILNTLGGSAAFLLFAIASLIHIWFIKKYIPETRNKSLEEIEKEILG